MHSDYSCIFSDLSRQCCTFSSPTFLCFIQLKKIGIVKAQAVSPT